MGVHILLLYDAFNSLRKIPRRGIEGSNVTSSPTLRNLHTDFPVVIPIYTSTNSSNRFLFPYSHTSACYWLIYWYKLFLFFNWYMLVVHNDYIPPEELILVHGFLFFVPFSSLYMFVCLLYLTVVFLTMGLASQFPTIFLPHFFPLCSFHSVSWFFMFTYVKVTYLTSLLKTPR